MKQRILIIDDSMPIRYLLEAMFRKEYNVVSAQDGLAAMAWLSKGNMADVIITDLAMPNVNGWELLDYLADSHLYKDIPVVVLSGSMNDRTESITELYSNVHEVMRKPFDPVELMEKVEGIISKKLVPVMP
ncbi:MULTISPECIES: response regulator [Chitinophaga]|jgi:CheY-like chemotaxis protein|uniref:Response regulator receiver domain-containing protein n=1 Tax=Chitinophaga niabensis TaxID=536979 RepID=A0A1N6EF74_9BACT|nr:MULTISPECIES: response regulator [Chitinophaga]MRG44354.1 response regulator [Chitinophaga sp. SYP-B3965]SIN81660.1 Response regulator receiver domain-containing protein [Chitinophaga niabensis]